MQLFVANIASFTEDEFSWTVALADKLDEPLHYLVIQRSKEEDEQDRELGQDNLYFELDGQSASFYGGVEHIHLSMNRLDVKVTSAVAKEHNLDTNLQISFGPSFKDWQDLRANLVRITEGLVPFKTITDT